MARILPQIGLNRSIRALVTCLVLGPVPGVQADLIYFKDGGSAQLPARRSGASVILGGPGGEVEVAGSTIARIVPHLEPEEEWSRRQLAAGSARVVDRFDLAWWAIENGLTSRGIAAIRAIQADEPKDVRTAALIASMDATSPPLADPDQEGVAPPAGGDFRSERSPHFLLYHQVEPAQAAARLELLERVYATFYLTFAAQGLALHPPRARLVGILFARERDYLDYLDRESASAFRTSQGFYHPTRNVVVAFEARDVPSTRAHLQALERRKAEILRWHEAARRMPAGARLRIDGDGLPPKSVRKDEAVRWVAERRGDADRQSLLLDLQNRSIDLGLAAHETVHQLIANSGLAPRHDAFPTWLHEGIAMQFEVIRGGRWAGVGQAHDLRLPDWRSIRPAPRLAPLVRDEGLGVGYRRDPYAAAWAFVYFLRKQHPSKFATLIDLLRIPARDRPDRPAHLIATVRAALGADFASVEADWHKFMRGVETPLEAGKVGIRDATRMPSGRD